mgnify:CR=1 FL=1
MSSAPHQRVTGILVVHGVGAQGRGESVQKLLKGLSLVEGAEVEHASAAIGGDPIEFRLFGNGISLRHRYRPV